MCYYTISLIIIPLFIILFYFKYHFAFYLTSIFYPVAISILLLTIENEQIINLYSDNFIINFSYQNKLIGLAFTIVTLAANLYAINLGRKLEVLVGNLYFTASLIGLFAGDFILLFIALELMIIFASILIFYGNNRNNANAARQYFITHLISGSLILIGISYIIINNSNTDIISLTTLIEKQDSSFIFYALIFLGCLINVAVPPFSGWLVNCYPAASTSGMIYLTSFTSKLSIIILLKLFAGLAIVKFFGIIMILYGGFYACKEDNIKRFVCYLTVSQLGFMLIAIGTNSPQSVAMITAFLFVHILYKALFCLYIAVIIDQENIENCSEITGLGSIDFLYKSKIVEEFLEETKPSTAAYINACEERRRVSTTKSPTRFTYARSLMKNPLLLSCLIISIVLIIAFPPLASFTTKITITNSLDQDINFYVIMLLKIVTCAAIFSTIPLKSLSNDFNPNLNILAKLSLWIMLLSTFITSLFLEKILSLLWPTYPIMIFDIYWFDIVKQIMLISTGAVFALFFSKIISRSSTTNINLDLFRFIENNIRNIYSQYKYQMTDQTNEQEVVDHLADDYYLLKKIEKNTLRRMKSWHNQSSSLMAVIMLLVALTILLISK
jgi:multicomponent Na+:H+ antiporter subunit D